MIVTLLTDFGTSDYFVAAMKGVMLSIDPRIVLVDVSHTIPRHDVAAAAFQLAAVYRDFPPGTVHLVVVDPGVGSPRLPIAARAGGYFFVGPDNGVFGMVDPDPGGEARQLANPLIVRSAVSATFHGRDLFAPAAAALATGFPFDEVGPIVQRSVTMPTADVIHTDGYLTGTILHIDHFGNCVTSFRAAELLEGRSPPRLVGRDWEIVRARPYYQDAGTSESEAFAIAGSAGFLEISVYRNSAARLLGIAVGDIVKAFPAD